MSNEKTTIVEELKAGKPIVTFTSGSSMEPLLYERKTHVVIEPLVKELEVGELPIFLRKDGKYVIHRIIRVDNSCYYTRGDNCIGIERVPKEQVLGKVAEIYRNGKRIKVTDFGYKIYVKFWMFTSGLRICCYRVRARIKQ